LVLKNFFHDRRDDAHRLRIGVELLDNAWHRDAQTVERLLDSRPELVGVVPGALRC
jgi:hypothetical protein